jgi:hypothetical protein
MLVSFHPYLPKFAHALDIVKSHPKCFPSESLVPSRDTSHKLFKTTRENMKKWTIEQHVLRWLLPKPCVSLPTMGFHSTCSHHSLWFQNNSRTDLAFRTATLFNNKNYGFSLRHKHICSICRTSEAESKEPYAGVDYNPTLCPLQSRL